MATMRVLTVKENYQEVTLGPTVSTTVLLEETPVSALLDTGSPVTIVSLNFLLQVLKKQRTKDQIPTDWAEAVRQQLSPPTVTLRNYGGEQLSIIRQVRVKTTRRGYTCKATILVQKNAPLDLLIGTDLLAPLGFLLMQKEGDGQAVDLLGKREGKLTAEGECIQHDSSAKELPLPQQCSQNELFAQELPFAQQPNHEESSERDKVGTVRLLTATRIPARHGKIVRAKVEGEMEWNEAAAVFEYQHYLKQEGMTMEDALTLPDSSGYVTLVVLNNGGTALHLPGGQVLGYLQPTTLVDPDELTPDGIVGFVDPRTPLTTSVAEEPGREQRLLTTLHVDPGLTQEEHSQLETLLIKHADVFALNPSELGSTEAVKHTIDTGDQAPMRQPPRRIPVALRETINTMVDDMLQQEVIRPSHSPWASPVVLVTKKDGSTRFCVDYRKLNSVTKMDVFPLPRIDDTLDLLSHSSYFTTLDLATGYWQVKMAPEAVEKTAFATHSGLYEFQVMPFGLCNAPATFQRLMETVLTGLARNTCTVYIDDIMVMGATFSDHLKNLSEVLDRLKEAGLRLKPTKCRFAKREVEYLGYIISEQGIAADPKKVDAVQAFPTPRDLKTLRSFIGLASYYRRFIPNFSKVAQPLFALTRQDVPFKWDGHCQEALDKLKSLLTQAPLLAFPDFSKEFQLDTDASYCGLGAVLSQEQDDGRMRPIAYASRTLQRQEQNYAVTELEALGAVWAVKHFRHYLYGHRCHLYTDHEALKSLLNTPHPSGKLARWGLALQELDLQVHYRPGEKNLNADFLSRNPKSMGGVIVNPDVVIATVQTEEQPAKDGKERLHKKQYADPDLAQIMDYLETGSLPPVDRRARELVLTCSQWEIMDGILYHVEPDKTLRLVVPREDRQKVFEEAHGGEFGGHLREAKMHGQLSRHYWWPRMRTDISKWCRECRVCASRQVGRPVRPPLIPIPVAGPFDRVGVDIIHFPKSQRGNQYAVVFVDYLTKWPEVFATADQSTVTVARLLVEHIIPQHGVPAQLLSDRGKAFLSKLMMEIYQLMGIRKANTTAYHPQTDGLVERFNRTLTDMLAKTTNKHGTDWDERLPYVLYAYRSSTQQSTKESPFFLLYGRDPRLPTEEALTPPKYRDVENLDDYKSEMVTRMTEAWSLARKRVKEAQCRQKDHYDRHTTATRFRVGDRVFVHMPAAKRGKAYKFAKPFKGPYRVMALVDNGAEVQLIEKPQDGTIRVALKRVRLCPREIADPSPDAQPIHQPSTDVTTVSAASGTETQNDSPSPPDDQRSGSWQGRLRPRRKTSTPDEDVGLKDGDV